MHSSCELVLLAQERWSDDRDQHVQDSGGDDGGGGQHGGWGGGAHNPIHGVSLAQALR